MPRFSYKAYGRDGGRIEGELLAATRESALEAIVRRGEFPVEIAEAKAARELPWWQRDIWGSGRLSLASLALFTRELVSLVRADLPIDECLRLLALQPMLPARLKRTVADLLTRITEGDALSDALASQPGAFPEYYWRLIKAAETSGALEQGLEDLARYLERSAEARARIASALLYPAVLVAASLAAIGVVVAVLVPAIAPIFRDAGAEPPWLIAWLGALESTVRQHWALLLVGAGLAVALAATALRSPALRPRLSRLALASPGIGLIIERRDTGRLARTLATLLRNGVPLLDAVRISADALSNAALAAEVRGAGEEIKAGGALAPALTRSGLFSDLFLRLTVIGEQTAQLDTMLQRAAEIYEQALERQLQRLTSLITPAVTLLIGLVVGGHILSVMSALVSVNDLAIK